jgi:hypothetical protein
MGGTTSLHLSERRKIKKIPGSEPTIRMYLHFSVASHKVPSSATSKKDEDDKVSDPSHNHTHITKSNRRPGQASRLWLG